MASEQPSTGSRISRRALLVGGTAAVAGVASAAVIGAGLLDDNDNDDDSDHDRRARRGPTLRRKGVNLDTDRTTWRPEFVRNEMRTIARDLHANAVLILGHEPERLVEAAQLAADEELAVWIEARRFDAGPDETLTFLEGVARDAERLRSDGAEVGLSVGVELTLFLAGLVPGADWLERGQALGSVDSTGYNAGLNRFLADAVGVVGPVFGGELTYSSGPWEQVDWAPFDVVGVDLYRDATNRATYVDELRRYLGHGKPVFVTEFGCCTFEGAADRGGEGFMETLDGDVSDLVRDEEEQATEVGELLDIYAAEGVDGAFVYNFIEPDNTWSPDPLQDLDMTGFGLVKCFAEDTAPSADEAYVRTGHFEPKQSFRAVALRYEGS
jgi:hypothetical protein